MKVDELLIKNHDDFSCTSIVDFMATYIGQAESVLLLSHDKSQQSLFDTYFYPLSERPVSRDGAGSESAFSKAMEAYSIEDFVNEVKLAQQ